VPSAIARSARNSSIEGARGQHDVGSAFGGQEQAGVSPWNALQQPGPAEDWLRRVREGAPHLLRPVERSEPPSSAAPRPAIENGEQQGEAISASPPRSDDESAPVLKERTIEGAPPSSTTAASHTISWFQRLHRRFRPAASARTEAQIQLKIESQDQAHSVIRMRAHGDSAIVTASARHESAGEGPPQPCRASQPFVTKPEPAALPKIGSEVTRQVRWKERVRQRLQALLRATATNRPASEAFIDRPKEESVFPKRGQVPSPAPLAVSTTTRVGQLSGDAPSDRRGQLSSGLWGQARAQDAAGLWPDLRTGGPFPASNEHGRNQTQENSKVNATQRARRRDGPPAPQPVDRRPWPEPEQVDSWPALLEAPPRPTTDWAHFLRNAERLRALDLEQRGGR